MKNPFSYKAGPGFTKNLITLVTGTSIAQSLPVLVSPVLTRIYSPDDFGILAIFMSLSVILGIVANLKYELAVLLPEKDENAANLVSLGLIVSVVLSLLLALFLLLFSDQVITWLNEPRLKGWIYLVPAVVLLIGVYGMLNYFNTRIKKYKSIAFSRVAKSVAMVSVQLVAGFGKMAFGGLILGYAVSHLFGNIKLFRNFISNKRLLNAVNKNGMLSMAKRYKRFPQFTFPATLSNKMATDLTNILISVIFTVTTLGFYSLAMRMLAFPSSLIGTSVGQLYMQEATSEKNKVGKATQSFGAILVRLGLFGLPLFAVIFIFAEPIFGFVFGEEWRVAGTYARYLIPLLYIRFVVSPVSVSLSVFEKQHLSLYVQLGMLIVTLLVFGYAWYMGLAFETFLLVYVITLSVYYLFFLLILFKTVKGK